MKIKKDLNFLIKLGNEPETKFPLSFPMFPYLDPWFIKPRRLETMIGDGSTYAEVQSHYAGKHKRIEAQPELPSLL